MTDYATLLHRQEELESLMQGLGIDAFRKRVEKAREKGQETAVPGGLLVMKHTIQPLSEAIQDFLDDAQSGRPGRRHLAVRYLQQIKPDTAAFIIAKTVFDGLTARRLLTDLAISLGSALEDEVRFRHFEDERKALFNILLTDVKSRTSSREWQRKVLIHSMNKADLVWSSWSKVEKLHLGQKCLTLLMEATGMFTTVLRRRGRKTTLYFEANPETIELATSKNGRCEVLTPAYLPTVLPPKPWTTPNDGGYYFTTRSLSIVKTRNRNYLEELSNRSLPLVYDALNAMQETAWKINNPIREVMREVWDADLPLGDLPSMEDEPLPAKPLDIDTNKENRTAWKRMAARTYDSNTKLVSKRLQLSKCLWVADMFKDDEALYFPHQLDFRGRAYAVPLHLNPQGPDWAKALLTFAKGKPIADTRALGWLMIQGANCYGEDKVALDARIQWVLDNEDAILHAATFPLESSFWSNADKPWQFLAFCMEYKEFQECGWGYVSHLPVALDGSCNGLQHFAAMMRDPVGGKATNLVPSEKPEDIYQRVCDVVKEKLRASHWADVGVMGADEKGRKEALLARQWLLLAPDRKMTKRPVMVLPYGGTRHSCRAYVEEWLRECRPDHPWGNDTFEPARFMAELIWNAIGQVVVSARHAMGWLQDAARIATSDGLPITWETPDGFPVSQAYPEVRSRRIETQLGDQIVKLTVLEDLERLDAAKQAQGISPNFVHSMDATAMRLYVNIAKDNGIDSFALIHDSFGTLAADTDTSAACLREAFVDMYEGEDVLSDLRRSLAAILPDKKAAKLPEVPPMGDLMVSTVRDSEYFFA